MLKLYKNGKTWYIRGTVAGRRFHESTRTADETQAERYLAKRQAEIYQTQYLGGRERNTFGQALNVYLDNRGDMGATSRRVLLELLDEFGNHYLDEIDQNTLDRYIGKRHKKSGPDHIIRSVITPMTAVMRVGAKRGWCDVPMFDRPKTTKPKKRALEYHEATSLVDAAAPHLKPLLVFMLNTGCRIGEALTLQWYALDLDERTVMFGKTDQDKTKNGKARCMPLNQIALATLIALPSREDNVFLTNKGIPYHRAEYGGQIKTGFAAALRRSGIGHCTPHDLRRTFASWIARQRYPTSTVSELLGHSRGDVTGLYEHFYIDHLREPVESIVHGQMPNFSTLTSVSRWQQRKGRVAKNCTSNLRARHQKS